MTARRRPLRIGRLVLWSVNALVCLFLLAPILVVIVASFSRDAYLAFPPKGLSLRWYQEFLGSRDFVNSLDVEPGEPESPPDS